MTELIPSFRYLRTSPTGSIAEFLTTAVVCGAGLAGRRLAPQTPQIELHCVERFDWSGYVAGVGAEQ